MDTLLDDLNEHQRCAVTSVAPVLQVLAPPGSGKTKTLTSRVAYLMTHRRYDPWNIIVCTFTLKAAREMKARISAFVGPERESKLILGTFHSICRRYLTRYGHYIGLPTSFGIADSTDTLAILKRLIKRHDFAIEPGKARSRISRRKSKIHAQVERPKPQTIVNQEFDQLYGLYEETLKTSNLLDYDDLLLRCVQLLREHPECCSNIQAILVDEFQDTNTVQYELINLIAQHDRCHGREPPSITIVGDPDQSIYSFRSAEIKNLISMQDRYKDTQVVMLQENYRSAGAILDCAMQVIEQDTSRPAKRMQSTHGYGSLPVLRELQQPKQEAYWIVREVQRLLTLSAGLLQHADFAILLRSASLSRLIESELGIAGIPYRMVGGHRFFDRKEVKVLLDYMRVIAQPDHTEALLRIINEPSRKIGDVTVKNLIDHAERQGWTLWELITRIVQKGYVCEKRSKQADDGLAAFFNIITRGQMKLERLDPQSDNLSALLDHIVQATDFHAYLKRESQDKETLENRLENVNELRIQAEAVLLNEAREVYYDHPTEEEDGLETQSVGVAALSTFLTNVALATDSQAVEGRSTTDVVTISTIHAAKGLEWPVVFVPALYEGSIPHSRAEDNDEERRLLYVGMTRAQALLYLSWPSEKSRDEAHCLSSFVTASSVRKKFKSLGPSLDNYQAFVDMSHVLRRECPGLAEIQEARQSCQYPYDLTFMDERKHPPSYAQSSLHPDISGGKQDRWQTVRAISQKTQPYMRARPLHTGLDACRNDTLNTGYHCNSGFTSAAVLSRMPETSLKRNATNTATDLSAQAKQAGKKQKKRESGQGTLAGFFQTTARIQQRDTAVSRTAAVRVPMHTHASQTAPIRAPMHIHASQTAVRPSSTTSSIATSSVLQYKPIRSIRSTPQPVVIHEDDVVERESAQQTTKYILLSSSPPMAAQSIKDENFQPLRDDAETSVGKVDSVKQETCHIAVANAPKPVFVRRLGTGGRAMKSWSEIQRAKNGARP